MHSPKTWQHNCRRENRVLNRVFVEIGHACLWCGATEPTETNYCQRCGLLTDHLTDELCPGCKAITPTIEVGDNALGNEAADVSAVPGYRVGTPHPVTNS